MYYFRQPLQMEYRKENIRAARSRACGYCQDPEIFEKFEDVIIFSHNDRTLECMPRQDLMSLVDASDIFAWPRRRDMVIQLPYSKLYISGTDLFSQSKPNIHTNIFKVFKPSMRIISHLTDPRKMTLKLNVSSLGEFRYGEVDANYCYTEVDSFGSEEKSRQPPNKPIYKLLDWIDPKKLDWYGLSYNPHPGAIEILTDNRDKINWHRLSGNSGAMDLLLENQTKIDWEELGDNESPGAIRLLDRNRKKIRADVLSTNPAAIDFLVANPRYISWDVAFDNPAVGELIERMLAATDGDVEDEIDWGMMSSNPSAIRFLLERQDQINWTLFSENSAPEAIRLLTENQDRIYWPALSSNRGAIALLAANVDKIDRGMLALNNSPGAIAIMRAHPELIDWNDLHFNKTPEALELLRQNPRHIDWGLLFMNPLIFELDHKAMGRNFAQSEIWTELMDNIAGPTAVKRVMKKAPLRKPVRNTGGLDDDDGVEEEELDEDDRFRWAVRQLA